MIDSFENFPVYKKILAVVRDINSMCLKIKGAEHRFLKDQIKRASSSILLNLAEGSVKWSKKDKANYYRISQASACESIAALDVFLAYNLVPHSEIKIAKELLREIVSNLNALVISVDKRIK